MVLVQGRTRTHDILYFDGGLLCCPDDAPRRVVGVGVCVGGGEVDKSNLDLLLSVVRPFLPTTNNNGSTYLHLHLPRLKEHE